MERTTRCPWANYNELYVQYHDVEWGVPVRDDKTLFEFLILEGAQAGLSWLTILKKRDNYRKAYCGFDPHRVAAFDDKKIAELLEDKGIVRNRLKVRGSITNAGAFLAVQRECGSFSNYLWSFVNNRPVVNAWTGLHEVPAQSALSDQISKDLKKRGFTFVGSTIVYAFLQAVGVLNDHLVSCFRHKDLSTSSAARDMTFGAVEITPEESK